MNRLDINLVFPPDCDYKTQFKIWKEKRKDLVRILGRHLLQKTEIELVENFEMWEKQIAEYIKIERNNNYFIALLLISILHYFNRSSDNIREHTHFVKTMLEHKSPSIISASAKVFSWLADESSDCIDFIHELMELVPKWITNPVRKLASLQILITASKFILPSVFEQTSNHYTEIWNCVNSDNLDMRSNAAKVLRIHFRALPASLIDKSTKSIYNDCIMVIKKNKSKSHGAVLVCYYLNEIHPDIIQILDVIDPLQELLFIRSDALSYSVFRFIFALATSRHYAFTPVSIPPLINNLICCMKNSNNSAILYDLFERIITLFLVHLPVQSILEFLCSSIKNSRNVHVSQKAAQTLGFIFNQFSGSSVKPAFFKDIVPSPQLIYALRQRMALFNELKSLLKDWYQEGLLSKSTNNQSILSLTIFKEYGSHIFDNFDYVYEQLSHLSKSPNIVVRLLMVSILNSFRIKKALDDLLYLALFDPEKSVRAAAVCQMTDYAKLSHSEMLPQVLTDPSYKVRRNAIILISKIAPYNPMLFYVPIASFMQHTLLSMSRSSNPCICQRISSLLPLIAQYFVNFCPPLVAQIVKVCYSFLNFGNKNESLLIQSVVQRDMNHEQDALIMNQLPFDSSSPHLLRVFQIENQKFLDKRDVNLFKTIGCLAPHMSPYIDELIQVFIFVFNSTRSPIVYEAAINSMIDLANELDEGAQIPSRSPELIKSLMKHLKPKTPNNVAILILKAMANFGITTYPRSITNNDLYESSYFDNELDYRAPSFYTDFVMKSLQKLLIEPHSSVFEAITSCFINDSQDAFKFLAPIISSFAKAIAIQKPQQKEVLFNQLEIISYYCGVKMQKFSRELVLLIEQNLKIPAALKLGIVLSYFLKTEFIPSVGPLFHSCLKEMPQSDNKCFKSLMELLTYTVIFQNQPLDLLVTQCENQLFSSNLIASDQIVLVLRSLTMLVQLTDASFECSHITRICIRLMKTPYKSNLNQLLFSLAVYCRLSIQFLEMILQDEAPALIPLKDYLNGKTSSTDSFLEKSSLNVSIEMPDYIPLNRDNNFSVFESCPPVQHDNIAKWREDLCSSVVKHSPSLPIRSCYKIISHSQSFREEIFPVAFLSCWRVARVPHREIFSTIFKSIILSDKKPVDQSFPELAELLARDGRPLMVSNLSIAQACHSPAQALRFLTKHIQENQKDINAYEMMLQLNTKLGRHQYSLGILDLVQIPNIGKWNETLEEWDKALSIYEKEECPSIPSIVRCYARLERWSSVCQMAQHFRALTPSEKQETAIWIAWAYYKEGDINNVRYYANFFPKEKDLNHKLFKQILKIATNQFDKAEKYILHTFESLVQDCSIFSSLNANQADSYLMFANHLIELKETLKVKKNGSQEVPKIWRSRLNYLNTDGYSWMRLVEIRNLIANPSLNISSYLKLLSVLMKERKWTLVRAIQPTIMQSIRNPEVQIAYIKLLTSQNLNSEALENVTLFNTIYNEFDETVFCQKLSQISESVINRFFKNLDCNNMPLGNESIFQRVYKYSQIIQSSKIINDTQRAKLLRIEANLRSLSQKDIPLVLSLLEESALINPKECQTWALWAYTNTKALDLYSDNQSKNLFNAITGFLKASSLEPKYSLEYLCQMFSLFFKYGQIISEFDEIKQNILDLPHHLVEQVLPQIVCHITHPYAQIQEVVHTLIGNFSENHFQSISFPLHLIALSHEEKKANMSQELLHKASILHPSLSKESIIFVDGLHRAAVTWFEIWLSELDIAFADSSNREQCLLRIKSLIQSTSNPKCLFDQTFYKQYNTSFNNFEICVNKYLQNQESISPLWVNLRNFYKMTKEKFNKIDFIHLSQISESLFKKRNFLLSIPGTYSALDSGPQIVSIDPTLPILASQQRPRLLYMNGNDGKRWKFLLKGNEDLRLDQRIMQFFHLINSLLSSTKTTLDLGITITKYPIVPLSPNSGLISWVMGADTLQQLVNDYRKATGISPNIELEGLNSLVGPIFPFLNSIQRLELWPDMVNLAPANELRDVFWNQSADSVSWMQCIDTFVLSTALMSMAGYVIGLGDRHPSNIMIQRQKGHVVHIDFGDSFEVTQTRIKMPEKVPFRLTRMITNAFGVGGFEGRFKHACESILYMLRKHKSSIFAQLEIFIHEPIFPGKDCSCGYEKPEIMERISAKLSGLDPLEDPTEEELDIQTQTSRLIKIATDHTLYITHYEGWCQFW